MINQQTAGSSDSEPRLKVKSENSSIHGERKRDLFSYKNGGRYKRKHILKRFISLQMIFLNFRAPFRSIYASEISHLIGD